MITKNGFNQLGAPDGKILAIVLGKLIIKEERIIANHRGIEIVKVKMRWEEVGNEYGIIPHLFLIMINRNSKVIKFMENLIFFIKVWWICFSISFVNIDINLSWFDLEYQINLFTNHKISMGDSHKNNSFLAVK